MSPAARAVPVLAALTLSCAAMAQDAKPEATKPAPAGQPAAAQPVMPPKPTPVPVPAGEVVKKTELESGLILEDLKLGEGYEVQPGGAVVCFYHGTLKEGGKVFDSAFDRGEPIAFPLSGVIQGWQKGVPGMKIGGVRRLTIPAAMAYGANSPSPDIPANSDLIFVIQLVAAVEIEDVKVGEGEAASGQCVAVTDQVFTDTEGKEVDRTEKGKPYIWFPGEHPGVNFGIEGMKVGGKRRIKIPKEFNTPAPGLSTTRPANVPLILDVELEVLRNIPQRGH